MLWCFKAAIQPKRLHVHVSLKLTGMLYGHADTFKTSFRMREGKKQVSAWKTAILVRSNGRTKPDTRHKLFAVFVSARQKRSYRQTNGHTFSQNCGLRLKMFRAKIPPRPGTLGQIQNQIQISHKKQISYVFFSQCSLKKTDKKFL